MHASARFRNVTRTVLVYLAAIDLGGCVLVHADDTTFDSAAASAFVRVRVDQADNQNAHRLGGDPAEMGRVTVVAEVYVRNGDGVPVVAVDAADAAAEAIQHALRARTLPLLDYVADASGATAVTGYVVRFTDPSSFVAAPPLAGWSRRILTAPGWCQIRHTTG